MVSSNDSGEFDPRLTARAGKLPSHDASECRCLVCQGKAKGVEFWEMATDVPGDNNMPAMVIKVLIRKKYLDRATKAMGPFIAEALGIKATGDDAPMYIGPDETQKLIERFGVERVLKAYAAYAKGDDKPTMDLMIEAGIIKPPSRYRKLMRRVASIWNKIKEKYNGKDKQTKAS